MQKIVVKVENDHIERLTSGKPLLALSELIWNAYDADASKVTVDFEEGRLTKLGLIRVSDNGIGIPFSDVNTFFESLGGSWKKRTPRTNGGRTIHGEKGQGRFKAFSLGNSVTWISNNGGNKFSISGQKSNLKEFVISEIVKSSVTGCTVEIEDTQRDFEIRREDGFADQIRDVFALQLYEDPDFKITFDGEDIDPRDAIKTITPYEIEATHEGGNVLNGRVEIIEWKKKVERKLMLCLPGRFSFHIMAPGIRARGFEFTAYLTSEHFQKLVDENTEGLVELDPSSMALVEAAKNKLREHFRQRETELSRGKIQEWKDAKIYPYEGMVSDSIERNERQVFDVVALSLSDYSPEFEKAPEKQQKLILQLIKTAIETGPSALPSILAKVIDLPKDKQEELGELLRKTSLTSVINAAKAVTDRLDFIKALQILVLDPTSKRQLLERSQLQKIMIGETWIFGEQFNLMNDDEDMSSVLKSHLRLLGDDDLPLDLSKPVLDPDGKVAIVDLMLSGRIPTPTDDERKHLVVELKRPSKPVNEDVISQIKKYAKAVALDDRFHHSKVEWDFLVISNAFTDGAELEARQSGKPRGLVFELDNPKIRVWAKTWGELITEAEGRLTFYKRRLEYQANDTEALRYLRTIDANYLSDEVKRRIAEIEVLDGDDGSLT